MEKAKFNAEEYYSVIGVLEYLETSLIVMDHYLPRYFRGASELYQKMAIKSLKGKTGPQNRTMQFKKNSSPHKTEINAEAKAILRANMTLEFEFYEFVKQRLLIQKKFIE